jgi:hypothetical protein
MSTLSNASPSDRSTAVVAGTVDSMLRARMQQAINDFKKISLRKFCCCCFVRRNQNTAHPTDDSERYSLPWLQQLVKKVIGFFFTDLLCNKGVLFPPKQRKCPIVILNARNTTQIN